MSGAKFKVGDVVRVRDDSDQGISTRGEVFTVTRVAGSGDNTKGMGYFCMGDKNSYGVWEKNLELIEGDIPEAKFQVGEWVMGTVEPYVDLQGTVSRRRYSHKIGAWEYASSVSSVSGAGGPWIVEDNLESLDNPPTANKQQEIAEDVLALTREQVELTRELVEQAKIANYISALDKLNPSETAKGDLIERITKGLEL